MAEIALSDYNIKRLKTIQKIVSIEEGNETDLDDALSRVLDFYKKFVPYD